MLERLGWARRRQHDDSVLPLLPAGSATFPTVRAGHRWARAGKEEEEEDEEGWCWGNPALSVPSRGKAGGGGDPVALWAAVQCPAVQPSPQHCKPPPVLQPSPQHCNLGKAARVQAQTLLGKVYLLFRKSEPTAIWAGAASLPGCWKHQGHQFHRVRKPGLGPNPRFLLGSGYEKCKSLTSLNSSVPQLLPVPGWGMCATQHPGSNAKCSSAKCTHI